MGPSRYIITGSDQNVLLATFEEFIFGALSFERIPGWTLSNRNAPQLVLLELNLSVSYCTDG
jgi:hypothetical protein